MQVTHNITTYSSQKHKETGSGAIQHRLKGDQAYVEEQVKKLREEQAQENAKYKRLVSEGNPPPQKYFKRPKGAPKVAHIPSTSTELLEVVGVSEAALPTAKGVSPPTPVLVGGRRLVSEELQRSKLLSMPTEEQIRSMRSPFHLTLNHHTGNTIACIGSSKRGKSTVIMHLYDHYFKDLQYISIMWNANPQAAVYKGHSKLIKALWGNGKQGAEIIRQQKNINVKTNNHYKFLNIFDDVLHASAGSGGATARLMDNLIMTYRNSRLSTIFSIQYSNLIKKSQRANFNHVLLFGMNTDEAVEVMVKTFLQGYLKKIGLVKFPDMINWYKAVTADHGFIYVMPADGIVSVHKLRIGD